MNKFARDMTSGSEWRHIVRFSLPLLAGNLLQQCYNIVDTIIVGKFLGDNAIAAIGATGSITFLFYTICLGLATGAGIIVSRYFGAKDDEGVKKTIFNSALVIFAFGVLISIVSLSLAGPVLRLLGTPENIISTSIGYMKISCAGTLAVAAYNWINSVSRALGDSKTPLIFLGVASVLNVGLDLLFVIKFNMGVNGAGLATIISQGVSALASIIYALAKNPNFSGIKKYCRFDKSLAVKCISIGIPIALQNSMISVSMVVLQRVTNTFGESVMAAYTVIMRIEQFIQQPFASLNIATSTFVGQNIGANKLSRANDGYKTSLKICCGIAVGVGVIFLILAEPILKCFISTEEVIAIGSTALRITSIFYIPLGMIHVTRGFLNGVGDMKYALTNGIVEVICRLGFSFILTSIPFIGYWGIWITTSFTWVVTAIFSIIRYRRGKWKERLSLL